MKSVTVHVGVLAVGKDAAPTQAITELVTAAGHRISARATVTDSEGSIRAQLMRWIEDPNIDVVVVSGGSDSDNTSTAIAPLVTQVLPGFTDLFRYLAFQEIGASAMLSNAEAAQCGSTFVFVLPAAAGAVRAAMEKLILPQLDPATTPKNLVSSMPRLRALAGDAVPQPIEQEKTTGGSGLTPKAPAPSRARSRTGANVVVRKNDRVYDDPTVQIEVERLEAEGARADTRADTNEIEPTRQTTVPGQPDPEDALGVGDDTLTTTHAAPDDTHEVLSAPAAAFDRLGAGDGEAPRSASDAAVVQTPSPATRERSEPATGTSQPRSSGRITSSPAASAGRVMRPPTSSPPVAPPERVKRPTTSSPPVVPSERVKRPPTSSPPVVPSERVTRPPTSSPPVVPSERVKRPPTSSPPVVPSERTNRPPTSSPPVDPAAPAPARAVEPDFGGLVSPPRAISAGPLPSGPFKYPQRRSENRVLWAFALLATAAIGFATAVFVVRAMLPAATDAPADAATPGVAAIAPDAGRTLAPAASDRAVADPTGAPEASPDRSARPSAPLRSTPSRPDISARASGPQRQAPPRPDPAPRPLVTSPDPRGAEAAVGSAGSAGSSGATSDAPGPGGGDKPPVAPPISDGCDEVACVVSRYERACCARFKPAGSELGPRVGGGIPDELDKAMVRAGVDKVKPRVVACGEQVPAKGTVRISVTVKPDGSVEEASVATAPSPELGECVAAALQRATFGHSVKGGAFTYPFVF